jgi:hypothetical protein
MREFTRGPADLTETIPPRGKLAGSLSQEEVRLFQIPAPDGNEFDKIEDA